MLKKGHYKAIDAVMIVAFSFHRLQMEKYSKGSK
jgi:hypothetical protein